MYTHCPNCDTHFEITQEYLDIANGKVRCGKCDHIFNALENLYDNNKERVEDTSQKSESADKLTQLHEQLISNKAQESPHENNISPLGVISNQPKAQSNANLSIPSIDIKEKMERIVASLSAATAELKSARQSTIFHKSTEAQENSHNKAELETKSEVTPPVNEPVNSLENAVPERGIITIDSNAIDESEVAPVNTSEHSVPDHSINAIDSNTIDENKITPVNAMVSNAADESEATPINESVKAFENADDIDSLTITPGIDTAESDNINNDAAEESISTFDEQLDIIDFTEAPDNKQQTVSQFDIHKVDPDDMDILHGLMQDSDANSDDVLLGQLDDINKTLSDENISLDDELAELDDEFDQLDNGDDLLAELEQLESDFLNNKPAAKTSSDNEHAMSEYYGSNPDFTEEDEDSKKFSSKQEHHDGHDDSVPSFLTQTNSAHSSPAAIFGWLTASLSLLALLFAQYLHFNSVPLSQDKTLRPFLESLCPVTGCSLPLLKTPKMIVTVTHDVHDHPRIKNALELQLTFKNKAPYRQGYPVLEVTFSNLLGEVIARRKFLPDEYLGADVAYKQGIKSNQSQQVSLETVDPAPGSDLSFQFNYL